MMGMPATIKCDGIMTTSRSDLSWQTSNMEYGRFYTQNAEKRIAGEREGRCEVLTKRLIDCRTQLGQMRLRDATSNSSNVDDGLVEPPTSSYLDAHLQKLRLAQNLASRGVRPRSNKTYSESSQDAKASHLNNEPLTNNDQHLIATRRIDTTGIEEDTKHLEWLLSRLADKLQPLTHGELPITNCDGPPKVENSSKHKENKQSKVGPHIAEPNIYRAIHHNCGGYKPYDPGSMARAIKCKQKT